MKPRKLVECLECNIAFSDKRWGKYCPLCLAIDEIIELKKLLEPPRLEDDMRGWPRGD